MAIATVIDGRGRWRSVVLLVIYIIYIITIKNNNLASPTYDHAYWSYAGRIGHHSGPPPVTAPRRPAAGLPTGRRAPIGGGAGRLWGISVCRWGGVGAGVATCAPAGFKAGVRSRHGIAFLTPPHRCRLGGWHRAAGAWWSRRRGLNSTRDRCRNLRVAQRCTAFK